MIETEIKALKILASSASPLTPKDLALALNIQPTSVYKILHRLEQKRLVERDDQNSVTLSPSPQAESFKRLYYTHHVSPLERILADRRLDILSRLDKKPKSAEELMTKTGISRSTLYRYLQDMIRLGIINRQRTQNLLRYFFNYTLWSELKDFISALNQAERLKSVPRSALFIKDYSNHILFKSLSKLDATPTAFSAYGDHGINLLMRSTSNYYTDLPKENLSIRDIFIHSLDAAESVSQRLYCILFYLKNEDSLKGIEHPMMKEIRAVLKGKVIKGYPIYDEVKDRMEVYGIKSQRGISHLQSSGQRFARSSYGFGHRRGGSSGIRTEGLDQRYRSHLP